MSGNGAKTAHPVRDAGYGPGMTTNTPAPGAPDQARAYAEDMGFLYCDQCGAVVIPQPEIANSGHECLATTAKR